MNKLMPLEFKNQRIILTKTLADQFGASEKNINDNFSNNKERFKEGKHYIKLEGQALKDFKNSLPDIIGEPLKFAPKLILWTDRGAARHAKILDTDEAWEVYEDLEESYFNPKESKPTCIEDVLISSLQEMKALKGEVQAVKVGIEETKDEIQGIRDVITLEPNQWRKDTANLINRIANKLGGFEHIKPVREEAYKLLDNSYGVSLKARLLNKQKKMALEGVPKYKVDKVNYLDVIADDKKLINGYIYIVGKLAVKHGVA